MCAHNTLISFKGRKNQNAFLVFLFPYCPVWSWLVDVVRITPLLNQQDITAI